MDCSRQAPLSMGILQARMLEWVAMPSFQGIFPTQGSNPGLLHYKLILYCLSHKESPLTLTKAYESKQALPLLFLHLSTYFFRRCSTELFLYAHHSVQFLDTLQSAQTDNTSSNASYNDHQSISRSQVLRGAGRSPVTHARFQGPHACSPPLQKYPDSAYNLGPKRIPFIPWVPA